MKIRLPKFIGRKLYFKCRRWEIQQQFTINPVIRIESKFYTYPMKTRNYGIVPSIGVKYYLVIGGRMKRYIVYIEIPDDHVSVMYALTRFKITAWLLTKKVRHMYRDDLITAVYDRKKGVITYEK